MDKALFKTVEERLTLPEGWLLENGDREHAVFLLDEYNNSQFFYLGQSNLPFEERFDKFIAKIQDWVDNKDEVRKSYNLKGITDKLAELECDISEVTFGLITKDVSFRDIFDHRYLLDLNHNTLRRYARFYLTDDTKLQCFEPRGIWETYFEEPITTDVSVIENAITTLQAYNPKDHIDFV